MSKNTISASATGLPSRRLFLASGPAAAVFVAAKEAYNKICAEEDAIPFGDQRKATAEHELRRLSDIEDDAFTAICAHPCATIEEARAKAAYIVAHTDFIAVQEYQFEALLRSFLN